MKGRCCLNMSKLTVNQRYIYKNNSSRFKDSGWELNLDIETAKKNNEIVSINDSIALRIIRDIIEDTTTEKEIFEIKRKIKDLKKKNPSETVTRKLNDLQKELEDKTILKELNSIVFDSISDWSHVVKNGVKLNDTNRVRTIGTSGGVKKNTVLFSDESIHEELEKRLNNGRNEKIKYVPAKFESYKALAFSGSVPMENKQNRLKPEQVLVVKDAEVESYNDVLLLSDNGNGGFDLSEEKQYLLKRQFTDGCGMISEKLSKEWANNMGCDYLPSGFNIRNAFLKGMVFTFPFLEFAENVAKKYVVKDAWGNDVDIRKVEIIVTTNMLKLWEAYENIEDYLSKCEENGFCFSVAKILPETLEDVRNMNYQFLESYNLTDEDIKQLVTPTIDSIKGALSEDYIKMLLFLKGQKLTEKDFVNEQFDYVKALMIDNRMSEDPFIRSKVYNMISKKINDAKKGVIEVNGNYQVASGDLYGLCQYMFGMEVTGILKANEFYSKYWIDKGVSKVVAYRAPMTVHNNIKVMPIVSNEEVNHWFRYMTTCTVLNAWDTTMEALNGMDFDADAIITTDNPILVNNTENLLAIVCEQKSTKKKKITKASLIKANKNGFGNDVGGITNKCTSMFDVLSKFEKGSPEYNEIMYRIICMQGYQQEVIDSIKGIIPKKVPSHWYNYKEVKIKDTDSEEVINQKLHNQKLLSDKKPYFFIYNYPTLMNKYKKYIRDCNTNCAIRFGLTVEELRLKENKSKEELKFLKYYDMRMPISFEKSLMNRLCWILEKEFDEISTKYKNIGFDTSIIKTGIKYPNSLTEKVKEVYGKYSKAVREKFYVGTENETSRPVFIESMKREIESVCTNDEMICEALIDICYTNNSSKQFVWDMCGDIIVERLLRSNNHEFYIPKETLDTENSTLWQGKYYKLMKYKRGEE